MGGWEVVDDVKIMKLYVFGPVCGSP